jgi:hypothetical protein
MAFKAFWGDMNFGEGSAKGAPLEVESKNSAGATSKVSVKVDAAPDLNFDKKEEEEEEEDGKGKPKPEEKPKGDNEDPDPDETPAGEKKKEKTETEDPEETIADFSEDELDRTFQLLDSQGILELGDDEEFDATPEGIAEAVALTIRKKVDAEFAGAPEAVKGLYNHLRSGKAIEDFDFVSPQDAWSEMNEDDEDNKKMAVAEFLILQGVDPEDVDEEVADLFESGKLDKKAELAFKTLIKKEGTDKTAKTEAKALSDKAAEDKALQEVEDIKTKIDSSTTMANFKMTDERKAAFKDYLFKENKKTGKSQFQENMNSEDRKLKIAFMDFVEFSQDDITKEVSSDLTKTRAKKLTRFRNSRTENKNSSAQTVTSGKEAKKGKMKIPGIFGGSRN